MDAVKEEEYKGYKIEIFVEENAESPREWDNLGKMLACHNRYNLGDVERISVDEIKETVEPLLKRKDAVVLPLYVYEHGGITMNTSGFSCPWDSGMVGYIYADADAVRENFGMVKGAKIGKKVLKHVAEILKSEVETYADYLEDNVYGYRITNSKGEEMYCLWGFIGDICKDDCYIMQEARGMVDHYKKTIPENLELPLVTV